MHTYTRGAHPAIGSRFKPQLILRELKELILRQLIADLFFSLFSLSAITWVNLAF
jgi:hypothetical protein